MSSPIVVTFQPAKPLGGSASRSWSCRRPTGRPQRRGTCALGRFDPEDQHVLGEPPLAVRFRRVAAHDRGDPQGEALLAQQGVAAIARTERPDLARLRKMDDVLRLVARPGTSFWPEASGAPTLWTAGTNCPSALARPDVAAHPRHHPHVGGYIGESDNSTPIWAIGEPSGPIENGMTYIVRPRIEPRNSARPRLSPSMARISAGAIQLLVGPASSWRRANERAILDPGDVAGGRHGQVALRSQLGLSSLQRSGVDHLGAQAVVLVLAPSHQSTSGFGQRRHIGDPVEHLPVLDVSRRVDRRSVRERSVHGGSSTQKGEFGVRLHRAAWRQRRVWAR